MTKNILKCTDCLGANGLKKVPSNSIDLIFADLPYGVTGAKWDSIIPMKPLFKQYKRIIKNNGAIVLFGLGLFMARLIVVGNQFVPFRYKYIWKKNHATNQQNCHHQPMRKYEEIAVFYKHQPTYNPQMRIGKVHNIHHSKKALKGSIFASGHSKKLSNIGTTYTNKYYPIDVLHFNNINHKNKFHPTQKPTDLLRYIIKTYTNKGDVVLDNTMGSGSTGVACAQTGRNFIGMEISKHYCNVSKKRIVRAGGHIITHHSHSYYYDHSAKHKAKVHFDYVMRMRNNPRSKYYVGKKLNKKVA